MKRFSVYLLLISIFAFMVGCGSTPTNTDNDKKESMRQLVAADTFVYTITNNETASKDSQFAPYTYNKYTVVDKIVTLNDNGVSRKISHIVLPTSIDNASANRGMLYAFFVVFDNGDISVVRTDRDISSDAVTEANMALEDKLCVKDLKKGMTWTSYMGVSVVERYEYVKTGAGTASCYKISTYEKAGDTTPIMTIWWTPKIGWFSKLIIDGNDMLLKTSTITTKN